VSGWWSCGTNGRLGRRCKNRFVGIMSERKSFVNSNKPALPTNPSFLCASNANSNPGFCSTSVCYQRSSRRTHIQLEFLRRDILIGCQIPKGLWPDCFASIGGRHTLTHYTPEVFPYVSPTSTGWKNVLRFAVLLKKLLGILCSKHAERSIWLLHYLFSQATCTVGAMRHSTLPQQH